MGFFYVGTVDGHNFDHLLPVLENVKNSKHEGPFLVHAITHKGKGYKPAEDSKDKYHGVSKFDIVTGLQSKPSTNIPSYTSVFAESLIKEAEKERERETYYGISRKSLQYLFTFLFIKKCFSS